MRRITFGFLTLIVLTVLVVGPVWGQTSASAPPKVIWIVQEHVKPGKTIAHEKMEVAWAQAAKKAMKTPPFSLGLNPVAGPSEVWFLWGADSLAKMAEAQQVFTTGAGAAVSQQYIPQEADFLSDSHSVMAVYREDLSNNPNVNWGEMRFMIVGLERVRKGHDPEYKEYEQLLQAAREKAGITMPVLAYEVFSGARASSYLYIIPLKDLEPGPDATLTGDLEKRRVELIDKAILEDNSVLFAISPGMSWPTPEMVATAPEFWTVKPASASKKPPTAGSDAAVTKPAPKK